MKLNRAIAILILSVVLFVAIKTCGAEALQATLTVRGDEPGPVINRNIYGQFAEHLGHCIYGGIWVGENSPIPNTRGIRNDVVAALRNLDIPVLRWPGGCFADQYHWRDGIGPRDRRPVTINTTWGGVEENNQFGTHEFLDLCDQLGCEPYICGNVGTGTPQEMKDWIEYLTAETNSTLVQLRHENGREQPWKIKYFGVGNESWGCGGGMTPEFYADNFRRYNTYVKDYSSNRVFRIACGANDWNTNWTEVLMTRAAKRMNGLSLHYYTTGTGDWEAKGSATDFNEHLWFKTLHNTLLMDRLLDEHIAIMDRLDPSNKVGLVVDEWGAWYTVEPGGNPRFLYQQNTLRDAEVAALNLHIFQKHARRVIMANIAQMVNVLQAMILTDGDKMLVTPTYWVFEMFKVHQGATFLPVELKTPISGDGTNAVPTVSASASRDQDGRVHLSLVNTDPDRPVRVTCKLDGVADESVTGQVLTAPTMQAHNTFDQPDEVHPVAFVDFQAKGPALTVNLPSKSVVMLEFQ